MNTVTWLGQNWPFVLILVIPDLAAIVMAGLALGESDEESGEKYSKTAMAWIAFSVVFFAVGIAFKLLLGYKDPAWLGEFKITTSVLTAIVLIILIRSTILTMRMMRKNWRGYNPTHFL